MNLSVKGEYALEALFDLASQRPGEPIKIGDIARRRNIPQKFLELILASLRQGGFVESRRGAEGGYLLARPADLLTVGEVLRFIEGPPPGKGPARRRRDPAFSELWQQVDRAVSSILDKTTLGDVLRDWHQKHSKYVMNWEI
jgi:Rrf2 family transcriptional regulator, cysteine metabolism repressor